MIIPKHPKITVLMPVYNTERFVSAAINSILKQSFIDFEFLVLDDGSTDGTVAKVEAFTDKRIRFIRNTKNKGVALTLNHGIELAKGKYIVRMDADDISYPNRLSEQFRFMESNPRVGVAGSRVRYFGCQPPLVDHTPLNADVIKAYMLFDNPLYHPSVVIRKSLLNEFNLRYDPVYNRSEDYELWLRATQFFPVVNLPLPLVKFRCHRASVTTIAADTMKKQALELLRQGLTRLGLKVSDEELLFHYAISKGQRMESLNMLSDSEKWLKNLVRCNFRVGLYNPDAFLEATGRIWFRLCHHSAQLGVNSWQLQKETSLAKGYCPPMELSLQFLFSIMYNKIISLTKAIH